MRLTRQGDYAVRVMVDLAAHANRCVEAPGACPRDRFCPVHPVWMRLQALLTRELGAVTIAALARTSHSSAARPERCFDAAKGPA